MAPFTFLVVYDFGKVNTCCGDTAFFSPDHKLSIYFLITISIAAYYYSKLRNNLAPPVLEIIINSILFAAIILNIFIPFQFKHDSAWIIGNPPIIILFFYRLVDNQNQFLKSLELEDEQKHQSIPDRVAKFILKLDLPVQFPILAIIALPVLFLLSVILMIFGQKHDSLVRSFTDTYKQGFSQLDYKCEGVVCGGHYLCTIAARGHKNIVRPLRLGRRANQTIICNRQLLISNAFEELLQERLPWLHRPIRNFYNRIGNSIHRHYWLFNYKLISDLIYILMKPLEWCFLFTLYLFDSKPENRIQKQYL